MSFLNITISYPNFQIENLEFGVSLKKRKIFIRSAISVFLLLALVYIYLTGLIVTKTIELEALKTAASQALNESNKWASNWTAEESSKNIGFFLKMGFEEPKTLDVIKRNRDAAKFANALLY